MKDLQQIFEDLPNRYATDLANIKDQKTISLYSAYDFFSLEPFLAETTNMPLEKLNFVTTPEDLEGNDQYLCLLKDSKLIFSRLFCGGEVYYDSFYSHETNLSWRFETYSNPDETKAIRVECIEKLEGGAPKCFRKYSMYGAEQHDFTYKSDVEIHIDIQYFDLKCTPLYSIQRIVFVKEDQSGLDKIISIRDGKEEVIFDSSLSHESIDSLLEKCKNSLIEVISQGIIANPPEEKDICLSLMEYNIQHPFPPTFAMATATEKEAMLEEYDEPLCWINAPDLGLFSEEDSFSIDFDRDEALYSKTNALINDMPFEEIEPKVIDTFVAISKALKKDKALNKSINHTKDYFVLARDYSACNEQTFMEKTLPKKEWEKWEKRINEKEKNTQDAFDQDPGFIELTQIVQEQFCRYEELLKKYEDQECEDFYSIKKEYFNKPFRNEIVEAKPTLDWTQNIFREVPKETSYFHYKMKDGKPFLIKQYTNGEVLRVYFLEYADNETTCHHFHVRTEPSLESYSIIRYHNGLPIECLKYTDMDLETTVYEIKEGKIISSKVTHDIFYSPYKNTTHHQYEFQYKDEQLSRITVINMNGKRSVSYCSDDSYMYETMEDMVELLSKQIVPILLKEDLSSFQGIVLEYENQMAFPPKVYRVIKDDFTEIEIPNIWNNDPDEIMFNFRVYTFMGYSNTEPRFTQEECLQFIDLAYQKLSAKITSLLKDKNNIDLKIVYKEQYGSTEEALLKLKI